MPTDITGACPFESGSYLTKITKFCDYWVFGEEHGEPTEEKPEGYHHWQFFFQLSKHRDWKWIHEKLPNIHVEQRKGTCEECMLYCMKDGNFTQGGQVIDRPGQGHRSDLEVFVEDCKTATDRELWVKHPSNMVRYYKVPDKIRAAFVEPRSQVTRLVWLFGPPGCGKTLYVSQKYPQIYNKDKTQWWDGYIGQKQVLIDELNSPDINYNELLKIGNKEPMKVQVKGGYVEFVAEVVVIVSNVMPNQVYNKDFASNPDAIVRRTDFYQCEIAGPHQLSLTQMRWNGVGFQPLRAPYVVHVDYPDDLAYVPF